MKRCRISAGLLLMLSGAAIALLTGCAEKPPPNMVHTPEDITGRIIGVLSGSPSVRLANDLGKAQTFDSGADLMYQLKAGAVDCVVMDNTAAAELVDETSGVRVLSEPLMEYDLRFASAKENDELLRAVNAALTTLESNGTLNGLRNRYVAGKSYVYTPPENVTPHPGFLTLAVPPNYQPYSYTDNNGEFKGLNIDVARAVCDYLGVELRIIEVDAGELINDVQFGKVDLALGWLPGDAEGLVKISDTYAHSAHAIIVRK